MTSKGSTPPLQGGGTAVDFDCYRSRVVMRDLLLRLSPDEAAALRSYVREIAGRALRQGVLTGAAIMHASLEYDIDLEHAVDSLLAFGTAGDDRRADAAAPAAAEPIERRPVTRVA